MTDFSFDITHRLEGTQARVGTITTPHGQIQTPAFIVGGTQATVKALTNTDVTELGGQSILANTYHLMLRPGADTIEAAGGLAKFMGYDGPTFTDSGGFQVLSLGVAYKKGLDAVAHSEKGDATKAVASKSQLAKVSEDGVDFRSHLDGSKLRMTPESSMELQHKIGADIHMAFDECVAPLSTESYLAESVDRTHRWAVRCLEAHNALNDEHRANNEPLQALYGVVQGGRDLNLRRKSASFLGSMDFDGYGIGGVFEPGEIADVVGLMNSVLPENKPRHLLGMGSQPADLFLGVEYGVDTFDCVAPTRQARNGAIYTLDGRIDITKKKYAQVFSPIEKDCDCYTCQHHTAAYVHHLFRAGELLANTLASIHNERFVVRTVDTIRQSIIGGTFYDYKEAFLSRYYGDKLPAGVPGLTSV